VLEGTRCPSRKGLHAWKMNEVSSIYIRYESANAWRLEVSESLPFRYRTTANTLYTVNIQTPVFERVLGTICLK
jgi:hypothetical protein